MLVSDVDREGRRERGHSGVRFAHAPETSSGDPAHDPVRYLKCLIGSVSPGRVAIDPFTPGAFGFSGTKCLRETGPRHRCPLGSTSRHGGKSGRAVVPRQRCNRDKGVPDEAHLDPKSARRLKGQLPGGSFPAGYKPCPRSGMHATSAAGPPTPVHRPVAVRVSLSRPAALCVICYSHGETDG